MFTVEQCQDLLLIEAWELWDGALRDHPGRGVLESLAKRAIVLCRYYGVPASLVYHGSESLLRGAELARWAREEPQRLADWLERQVANRLLEVPEAEMVCGDVAKLRAGETVKPWFNPN